MLRKRKFKVLEKALGYRFRNQDLLTRALTHSSANNGKTCFYDNERLEFIGDRVLGLAVAEYLGETFPEADEGELARRFNGLVRREACARIGQNIQIGAELILSNAEAGSGGRDKETIIADAVEAVLAAVFIDGGFEKARGVVRALWAELDDGKGRHAGVDAKSALQEWAQERGSVLPSYTVLTREGPDHAPRFTTQVSLPGGKSGVGLGSSKRASEQAAAEALLVAEGLWNCENGLSAGSRQ